MTDFIAHTKLPGVFLAKAMMSQEHFEALLTQDTNLQKKLTDIGYTLHLSPSSEKELTDTLKKELEEVRSKISVITHKAEIFSRLLTTTLQTFAKESTHDTETIYNLAQILFIWSEFIDFEDYQKLHGDIDKIRESIFYRAGTYEMQKCTLEEANSLIKTHLDTDRIEIAVERLKESNKTEPFVPEHSFNLIDTLTKAGFSKQESIYFCLILHVALFIKVSENLLNSVPSDKTVIFKTITDIEEGVSEAETVFNISALDLKNMLEGEAEYFIRDDADKLFS